MTTSNWSSVHPCSSNRCSFRRRRSARSKFPPKEVMKGEEHWSKVFQTKEHSEFYQQRCTCRKTLNSLVKSRPRVSENIIMSIFRRFVVWFNSRTNSNNNRQNVKLDYKQNSKCRLESSSACETTTNTHPVLIRTQNVNIDDIILNDADDPNYVYIRNNKSGNASPVAPRLKSNQGSFLNMNDQTNEGSRSGQNLLSLSTGDSGSRQNLTVTRSAPSQSQRTSRVAPIELEGRIKPYNTWPLVRKILDAKVEEKNNMFDNLETKHRNQSAEDITNVKEFSIPYEDLEFSACFRTGRDRVIYKGRWHGDVNIHYYGSYTLLDFWKLVTQMQRVRHENVALFMGTCTDFNRYAIIESIQDGISLYEHIHIQKEVSSMQSKIQLLRQISNGMGYLHAKGILVKNLNTRNIFLCPKARVSVMDYGIVEPHNDRQGLACLPRGYLTYIAPEILRTMMLDPPTVYVTAEFTKEADVFAFGTIVYELVTWRYPFFGQPPEAIIWQICTDQCKEIDNIKSARTMKRLMAMCWSYDPHERPTFADISRDLNRTISLHKRHSISEPDILNKTGTLNNSYC